MATNFLTARWEKLVIANYEIDPNLLQKYLPYGTELDLWEGKCIVSLIGFMFLHTKLKGIKVPFHTIKLFDIESQVYFLKIGMKWDFYAF